MWERNKKKDKKRKESEKKKSKSAINVKYPFVWLWSTVRESCGGRTEARCYRIVITSNLSDRWVLESAARFHAADGLAVCASVRVLIWGVFDGVYWNVRCVFINVSIDSAFLRGDWICFVSVGGAVRLHICAIRVFVCTQATWVCRTHKQTPKPPDTLDHWSSETGFYPSDSNMRVFSSCKASLVNIFTWTVDQMVLSDKPTGKYYSYSTSFLALGGTDCKFCSHQSSFQFSDETKIW